MNQASTSHLLAGRGITDFVYKPNSDLTGKHKINQHTVFSLYKLMTRFV